MLSVQIHFNIECNQLTGGWSSSLSGSPLWGPRGSLLPGLLPGGLTGKLPNGPMGSKRAPGGTDPL